jgi:hypothetical protein
MTHLTSLSAITLAAALSLTITATQGASAQQGKAVTAVAPYEECPEMAYEMAYETPREFVAWALARDERIKLIDMAERRSMLDRIEKIALSTDVETKNQNGN